MLGPPVETINLSVVLERRRSTRAARAEPRGRRQACIRRWRRWSCCCIRRARRCCSTQLAQAGRCRSACGSAAHAAGLGQVARGARAADQLLHHRRGLRSALNPIPAKVDLGMRVLTYMEFKRTRIGRDAYIAYQAKEALAAQIRPGAAAGAIRSLLPL